jgi:hypothetical protein
LVQHGVAANDDQDWAVELASQPALDTIFAQPSGVAILAFPFHVMQHRPRPSIIFLFHY